MIQLSKKIFFCVLVLFTKGAFSQQSLLKKANKEYEKYEYINAQETYLKMINKGYQFPEVYKKLGNSYYFNSQFKEASIWYEELFSNYKNNIDVEYYYRYAQTLKSIGNYEKSNEYMHQMALLYPEDKRVKLFLVNQKFIKERKDEIEKYSIRNLSMNSKARDFGTAYSGRFILFSSSRGKENIHQWNNEPYLDLYVAKKDYESNELYDIEKWNNQFNSDFHESTPVFSKDKQTFYFTRNNEDGGAYKILDIGKTRTDKLKIYRSDIDKHGVWSKPLALPFSSDEYSVAHPTLSNDEKKLYFSSDMPGGYGESDIYEVDIKPDGTYGEPKNLGKDINTEGKETFPYISKTGNLYFSSDGHVGFGGLDVFKISNFENETKFKIVNIGKPINSPNDDFTFIINENSKDGYFSSNRSGGKGKDDIYSFTELEKKSTPIPEPEPEPIAEPEIIKIKKGDDLAIKLNLNPIYFDLDKDFIRPDAAIELDKILKIMKEHPNMKIKIKSHTDSRAIWYYNTDLSKRRARSTWSYLVKNGIESNRMTHWGYGESQLVNKCSDNVDCSEEEHQLNRRSEFIVIEK